MLAGWAGTPSRFREDANAEQDAAGIGYADRLVVELAQNAVDAAQAAGVPGRLLLRWTPGALLAANTGAPLTDAGVVALSTLRASAKRDATAPAVGRFGVGFAAVLAVTDCPAIGSRGRPGVGWSAARTAELVSGLPALGDDVAARGGHVPVLRLPFSRPGLPVPAGYRTLVELPWRDAAAADLGRRLLAAVEPALLLALPGLEEVVVDLPDGHRQITCRWDERGAVLDGRRWLRACGAGPLPADLVPAGEQRVDRWTVSALRPEDGRAVPGVLHAPTPTDEPLSIPALVVASVPLEPTRRRVARGPLADFVLARAGEAVARLAALLDDPLPLVPVGLPAGDVDARLHEALSAALVAEPVLRGRRGAECVVLDLGAASGPVGDLLAGEIDGLLPAGWEAPGRAAALRMLGVRRWGTAEVVGLLGQLHRPPGFWARAYAALAEAPDRDALAALPVPLADGRLVTGPRGALLPEPGARGDLSALPVRLVHPDAVHPLLERLGARPATPAALLADPAVRDAVQAGLDEPDPRLAPALCALVASGGGTVAEHPWLAGLALPAAGGGLEPAADLLWPGGPMSELVDPDAGFGVLDPPPWLDRQVAAAIGVRDGPVLLRLRDVPVRPEPGDPVLAELDDLDGVHGWLDRCAAAAGAGAVVPELVAVGDLDAVADLPGLLRLIAGDRRLRPALVEPVRLGRATVPPYTAWWLAGRPVLDGAEPADCALPGDPVLAGLYRPPPGDLDLPVLRALGVWESLDQVAADPDGCGDLLDRLGDAERSVDRDQARRAYLAAARAWDGRGGAPDPPLSVRAVRPDGQLAAVAPDRSVVVDSPDVLGPVLDAGYAVLPVPMSMAGPVARLLGLRRASELDFPAPAGGRRTAVPAELRAVAGGPRTYRAHPEMTPPWRWVGGELHASPAGLPAGLAWAAGAWHLRHLLAELVRAPEQAARLRLEADLDG